MNLDVDLSSPRFKADPHPFYARARRETPVFRTKVAFWLPPIWVVTRYDDVLRVLKDERISKDYREMFPWVPSSLRPMFRNLLTLDPPDHTRLRSLVQSAFTPRLMERLRDRVQDLCDEWLDKTAASGRMDVLEQLALPLTLTIIADLLGVPSRDRPRFEPWANKIARAVTSADLTVFVSALPGVWRFMRYLRDLIQPPSRRAATERSHHGTHSG